jgi:hypothetical protein
MAEVEEITEEDVTIEIGITPDYRVGIVFQRSINWISVLSKDAKAMGEKLISKAVELDALIALRSAQTESRLIPEKNDG